MPELIARIPSKNLPPKLKKDFSEVLHMKEMSRIAIWGEVKPSRRRNFGGKERVRLGYEKFIEGFEHSAVKQKSQKAAWNSPGGPVEVTVSGAHDDIIYENKPMMKIKGSGAGLPIGELTWADAAADESLEATIEATDSGEIPPVIQALFDKQQEEINSLKTQAEELQTQLETANKHYEEVVKENTELKNTIRKYESGEISIGVAAPEELEETEPKPKEWYEKEEEEPVSTYPPEPVDGEEVVLETPHGEDEVVKETYIPKLRRKAVPYEPNNWWTRHTGWLRSKRKSFYPEDGVWVEQVYEEYDSGKIAAVIAIGVAAVALVVALCEREDNDSAIGNRITHVENKQTTFEDKQTTLSHDFYGHRSADNARDAANADRDHANKLHDDAQDKRMDQISKVNREQNHQIEALKKSNRNLKLKVSRLGGKISIEAIPGAHIETLDHYGDNIWTHVENDLEAKTGFEPSDPQVGEATQIVLDINGDRWNGGGPGVDAHKLPVGYDFQVPNDLGR